MSKDIWFGAEGCPVMVVRSEDPEKAIARALEIAQLQESGKITPAVASEMFNDFPLEQGSFTVQGYACLRERRYVLDEHGNVLRSMAAGDQFICGRAICTAVGAVKVGAKITLVSDAAVN